MRRIATTGALATSVALAFGAGCAVDRDAPSSAPTVHVAGFADPTSASSHVALLRARRWAPMLDANDADACGRCHAGAPVTPAHVTSSAPGAPACAVCHAEANGPLACTTCHADPPSSGAHAAHVAPGAAHAEGYPCSTCHPLPPGTDATSLVSGAHANGGVDVVFDASRVGPERSFDARTGVCAVACHDRGGARARLAWSDDVPARCGDCHGAPPASHPPGPCDRCHVEANADGTALTGGALHLNGRVDLGDGDGTCGACHGEGGDPRPRTGAHAAHASPATSAPIACATCHPVPASVSAPGHLDGVVQIVFTGASVARGARPTWDGASCAGVACHGAGLVDPPAVVPAWRDASHAASACGACHGVPPTQHTASTTCGRAACHEGEVARDATGALGITGAGRARHADGVIEAGP